MVTETGRLARGGTGNLRCFRRYSACGRGNPDLGSEGGKKTGNLDLDRGCFAGGKADDFAGLEDELAGVTFGGGACGFGDFDDAIDQVDEDILSESSAGVNSLLGETVVLEGTVGDL